MQKICRFWLPQNVLKSARKGAVKLRVGCWFKSDCMNYWYSSYFNDVKSIVYELNILHLFKLQDLIKHTPEDHPDYQLLVETLRSTQDFLSRISGDHRDGSVSNLGKEGKV